MASENTEHLRDVWNAVCQKISKELDDSVLNNWVDSLRFGGLQDGILTLVVPTAFLKDWLENKYAFKILRFCKEQDPTIERVQIVTGVVGESKLASEKIEKTEEDSDEDFSFGVPLDPELTFENFVVGKPNELAYTAAMRIAESDTVAFNPLFLYGGVGLGKTHLMHAIAWSIKARNKKRTIAYMSAEKFMYQFIRSVRYKDMMSFKEQFRSVDVLMIDDIQFICGKESTQEEFFHTFNALVDNNHQVIVSADKSPSDLEGMEDRLKSRLGWGLVADIHPTTYELRLGILQSKAARASVKIPDKVLEFVAHKITASVRELEGALNRIIASAVFIGKEITVDSAREVLADLLRASEKRVSVEEIQKKVATQYGIKLSDMFSSKRSRQVALPRQIAMYLCKKLTTMSLPEIGKNFGGKDHSTVLHAVKKIQDAMDSDVELSEDVKLLTKILQG
ncbi:MAG: chromosomal replication initiator protein DnaA [Alphaproteobacteria bacterium]|nr:chromosomal replication initiator protein DnaA [Alphaproteobacteria bacterium]